MAKNYPTYGSFNTKFLPQFRIDEDKMHLDKLESLAIDAEEGKGKHKAVLEAAIDAKRLVVEDSGPGLNAADAVKNLGPLSEWLKVDSVCYNSSLDEAATGCMYFHVRGNRSLSLQPHG